MNALTSNILHFPFATVVPLNKVMSVIILDPFPSHDLLFLISLSLPKLKPQTVLLDPPSELWIMLKILPSFTVPDFIPPITPPFILSF